MIRAALVLHLYNADVALELIDRISRLTLPADVFATHVGPLQPSVRAALDRLERRVETTEVPNRGWDIGPLLGLLPRLAAGGYEVIGKLHTKDAGKPDGLTWQQFAYEGLIASDALVACILAQFATHPGLALLGPGALYRSAATHLFRNDEQLSDMAARLMVPGYPPADWGFFAGTFFWTRLSLLEAVARLADADAPSDSDQRDGTSAHAIERLFGLAAQVCGGTIGLVEHGRIRLVPATAPLPREPILQALRAVPPRTDAIATLIAHRNPLLDYIRHGRDPDALDPTPYFSSRYYNHIHRDVFDAGFNPLHHYVAYGRDEGRRTAPVAHRNPLLDYIRHGRDPDALDPTPYFSTRWYNRYHRDVAAEGLHPLSHYIRYGAAENRRVAPFGHRNPLLDYIRHGRDADALDPNPDFSSQSYNSVHRDVFDAGLNPLAHYIAYGRAEGRLTMPVVEPVRDDTAPEPDEHPRRFYRAFDLVRERAFLADVAKRRLGTRAGQVPVSIVMPAYNGAGRIAAAIRSVLAQTHAQFELLIVDDGSTDATTAVVAAFTSDPRVRLITGSHRGVAAARNLALSEARGEIIAYLDCDNRWKPWYLEVMVAWMTLAALDIGYCAIALRSDEQRLIGYRGDDFDWAACLQENYVDLNGLCHKRALVYEFGGFDTRLRRMVDWDLILRYGSDREIGYAPFVGCEYDDSEKASGRITLREPTAFQALIRAKHRLGHLDAPRMLASHLRLAFAIKIAAPEDEREVWGDTHFAEGLKAALERLGHSARIDFRNQWYGHSFETEDVVIVLRGLIAYEPKPGRLCFIWTISHPDQVDWAEYDRYSRVYAASASYAALLGTIVSPPVSTLLQATDPARFRPLDDPPDAPEVLFVGNSRGVDREVVSWAFEAGHPPEIYGGGWEGRVPPASVKAASIDNTALGGLYAGAGVVLNDHWPSMRAFGLLSNRLFDAVASGARVISDPVPSMAAVFGDAVHPVDDAAGLAQTVGALHAAPRDRARERDAAARIHAAHSFDDRARVFVRDAFAVLGLDAPVAPSSKAPDRRLRVHVVAPYGPYGPQSSTFIRLATPLTDDTVSARVRLSIGPADQVVSDCDVCIVQRTALPDMDAAEALVGRVAALGAVLVTDVDDAFTLIDAGHPEHAAYGPRKVALDHVIAASEETWFSTSELARVYASRTDRAVIVPNAIDPRLWRDWRHTRPPAFAQAQVSMLYMGTSTHRADFALIRPALERLAEAHGDAFTVTLIGIAPDIAPAPWLHRLSPPAGSIAYPRFVRWLRGQGPFDLGLAPLVDTAFNRCKSDIKCLDYAALGMLPLLSDTLAYRSDPELSRFALFAGDEASWFEALRRVLRERDDAARRAAELQAYVWEQRSAAGTARRLLDRMTALCG